ncbi:hypothetical protein WDU94_014461 [Cyamophila willieti]
MAPAKKSVQSWIQDYPNVFSYDGSVLFCSVCEKVVQCTKKFQVDQHDIHKDVKLTIGT